MKKQKKPTAEQALKAQLDTAQLQAKYWENAFRAEQEKADVQRRIQATADAYRDRMAHQAEMLVDRLFRLLGEKNGIDSAMPGLAMGIR